MKRRCSGSTRGIRASQARYTLNVYWTEGAGGVKRIAKGGGGAQTIAMPAPTHGATGLAVALSGGSRVNIAEAQKAPVSIAADATHGYWTNYNGDEIMSAPK